MNEGDKLLLSLISKAEGTRDNYNTIYGVNKTHPLTTMTINEVLEWQQKQQYSAAGKYQIIKKTLAYLRDAMNLTGNELFDEKMQDSMALFLLDNRKYQRFIKGMFGLENFMVELAKEWASFPMPFSKSINGKWRYQGKSYYDEDGVNHARVSIEEVKDILKSVRALSQIDKDIYVTVPWWQKLIGKIKDFFS